MPGLFVCSGDIMNFDNPAVPFLLAGGNPNWKPREPVLGLRRFVLVSSNEQAPYRKDPRSTSRSRAYFTSKEEPVKTPAKRLVPPEAG